MDFPRRLTLPLVFALAVIGLPSASLAIDIVSCGQFVHHGQTGVLQADVDCSAGPGNCSDENLMTCGSDPTCTNAGCDGLLAADGATLSLNGHTVTGGMLLCGGRCTVVGPGTVVGGLGIIGRDVRVQDGVAVDGAVIGVQGTRSAKLDGVTVTNSVADGISAVRVRVTNVVSNGSGRAGIFSSGTHRVVGHDVTTNNNVRGILTEGGLRLTDLIATGNTEIGVSVAGGGTILIHATVTGNGTDIVSETEPRLVDTVCETSNWPVCPAN